jgi:hypothetical protein
MEMGASIKFLLSFVRTFLSASVDWVVFADRTSRVEELHEAINIDKLRRPLWLVNRSEQAGRRCAVHVDLAASLHKYALPAMRGCRLGELR